MFKRSNKFIAILIAATAVTSLLPATRVNAASYKKINTKDGIIYNAVAYKDGKFYVDGELEQKDESVYYLNNGKYTELDDINSEDSIKEYGTKYVEVEDGDYYVDLSNGKVTDDSLREDNLDNVAVSLRKYIKDNNDGRYDESDSKSIKDLVELPKSKFNDTWYKTQYKAKSGKGFNGGALNLTVYTDANGKYIDADYNLGKIKVKLSDNTTATVDNTNDSDKKVSASVTDIKEIGQDSKNIYRLAKITVKSSSDNKIKEINGINISVDTKTFNVSNENKEVSFNVIQVLSKSQASKNIDGIKYSKEVTSYIISDKNGKNIGLLSSDSDSFSIVNGNILDYKISSDSVEVQVLSLKSKGSYYYIEAKDSSEQDLQNGTESFDIDVDGNLWALYEDYIYKFDNEEDWEEVYKLDEELENLSVYDKNNIIAWNEDEELYSIIGGKTVSNDNTSSGVNSSSDNTNSTTIGWIKNSDNTWSFINTSGNKATGWINLSGTWYYLNTNGIMQTGWLNNNGTWYYLDAVGAMKTGWLYEGGKWYYLNRSGAMQTGWLNDNGTWYYLNASGFMLSNTVVNGYKLGSNGAWIK